MWSSCRFLPSAQHDFGGDVWHQSKSEEQDYTGTIRIALMRPQSKREEGQPLYWPANLVAPTSLYSLRRTISDHSTKPQAREVPVTASHSMT